jgi:hypothetical protein
MPTVLHPWYVNFRFLIFWQRANSPHSMRVTVARGPVAKIEAIF